MNKAERRENYLRVREVASVLRGMKFDHLPSKEKRMMFNFFTKNKTA